MLWSVRAGMWQEEKTVTTFLSRAKVTDLLSRFFQPSLSHSQLTRRRVIAVQIGVCNVALLFICGMTKESPSLGRCLQCPDNFQVLYLEGEGSDGIFASLKWQRAPAMFDTRLL